MQTATTLSNVVYIAGDDNDRTYSMQRDDIADRIVSGLGAVDDAAAQLQAWMLDLLAPMVEWDKKQINEDEALTRVFKTESAGTVRAKLAQWLEAFTPLRVQYERDKDGNKTGRILGVRLPKKPSGEWNLSAAKVTPFMEFKATSTKALSDPKIETALGALFRTVARKIDVDPSANINELKAQLVSIMDDEFGQRVLEQMAKETHQAWVLRYESERAEAKRAAA